MTRYVQGLSGNATAAAKNLTRVEAALERETSTLRSGLHSVQQISAHLKGQVRERGSGSEALLQRWPKRWAPGCVNPASWPEAIL